MKVIAFIAVFVPLAETFSVQPSISRSSLTRLHVSEGLGPSINVDSEKAVASTSPASVFGSPLSDATKNFNQMFIDTGKTVLFDTLFPGDTLDRAFARFYALETIARMPYFSYLSVLHLYETLGWWRRVDYLQMHFAESINELHHLLIMEDLGGSAKFGDRFIAQHIAFFYYWFVAVAYMVNPALAYNLNQAVEEHAASTYDKFLIDNGDWLKDQPAPQVAIDYYRDGDLYMFDEMHTTVTEERRRPKVDNLYDVFCAIRDDEMEHCKTMAFLQEPDANFVSIHSHHTY